MDFRPDLLDSSAYVEMCSSLVRQQGKSRIRSASADEAQMQSAEDAQAKLTRVGLDKGTHVASSDVVFVLTIANETTSEVLLSREAGPVGGFPHSALSVMPVHSGVSAKFPVVLSRIPRLNDNGTIVDLVEEVSSRMKLRWEAKRDTDPSGVTDMAKGHLRIPRESLKDIVDNHPSFVSRICEPPCQIELRVDGKPASSSGVIAHLAKALELSVHVEVSSWVPIESVDKCSLVLDFFCAKKANGTFGGTGDQPSRDYVWCGKLRERFRLSAAEKRHRIKIAFVNAGTYSVSACARIRHDDAAKDVEEIWWAPVSGTISVDKSSVAAQ